MPVYNGAKYMREAIESLLAQTYTNFELIISDNGSTDATQSICAEYAARDPRVRVFRFERNMGPAANYNKCVELARGEFYKFAAHDDVCAPMFVEKCVAMLDANPQVVNAYPRTKRIDGEGKVFGEFKTELDLSHPNTAVRFVRYLFCSHKTHHAAELWGVVRLKMLRQWSPTLGSYPSGDRVITSRMILSGPLKRVEEYLFFDREHTGRSEQQNDKRKIRQGSRLACYIGCGPTPPYQWWDASKAKRIVYPAWRWLGEYARGIFILPLSFTQRVTCLGVIAGLSVKFAPRLARDIFIAAELLLYRAFSLGAPAENLEPAASMGRN
ncbi:glycosyltransferase family 2 protein [soil metagenome]